MCQAWAEGGESALVWRIERDVATKVRDGIPLDRFEAMFCPDYLRAEARTVDEYAERNLRRPTSSEKGEE